MRHATLIALLALILVAGCPQNQLDRLGASAVTPQLAISSTQGDAPLTVSVSAEGSISSNSGALSYLWDFGDGEQSTEVVATHIYEQPGRYVLSLRVTDANDEQGISSVEIRVAGSGAVAVVSADPTSGAAPLYVQFDATQSQVSDDTIYDYAWDFGDGATSREAQPQHRFDYEGEYTVTLKITTGGGLEADTFTTIAVGQNEASLLFDGSSLATLPLPLSNQLALTQYTIEAWVKSDIDGGTLATLGDGSLAIELIPASNRIRLQLNGQTAEALTPSLAANWRHIAIVCDLATDSSPEPVEEPEDGDGTDSPEDGGDADGEGGEGTDGGEGDADGAEGDADGGDGEPEPEQDGEDDSGDGTVGTGTCVLYVDGVPVTSVATTQPLSTNRLTIGFGLRGKVADVRVWSTARDGVSLLATKNSRLTGMEPNLLGYWPMDDGSGQVLRNLTDGFDGMLGMSSANEPGADPAWSLEAPPL